MSGRLLSFYGDDFTGSTDALEAAASNGVPSVLFPGPPDAALLARFAACRVIGVAGESRSRGPRWMDENLPGIFARLREIGAPYCQYKVCSTFDSSPETGSIGRAIEIGQRVFGNPCIPIVAAAPHLRRHVVFGNLYAAAADGAIQRIDRHPMSRHPVTPMREADLRLHLARQTGLNIALHDILALQRGEGMDAMAGAVLFDGLLEDSMREAGRLIWSQRRDAPSFCVGSSGLTHALIHAWRETGAIPAEFEIPAGEAVDRLLVVSGSCSPATERQILWAITNGFEGLRFDGVRDLTAPSLEALGRGHSVVVYSALGAEDTLEPRGEELGRRLGKLLNDVVRRSGVRRVAIAGGDTSSHAARQLGIEALTFAGLLAPGAPLCRAHSRDAAIDGIELVLKGGQVGPEEFFEIARRGKP